MPTSITIRNVPDETRDELASRAAASGQSLQQYLLSELDSLAQKPSLESLMSRVRARKNSSPTTLAVDLIIKTRDLDRK